MGKKKLKQQNIFHTAGAFFLFRYRRMNPHASCLLTRFCTLCQCTRI